MHIGWIWPLSTWALSRRSADTYSARPDCRASPSSPFSSLGSNLIEGPKSAIRIENLPERMSISTKCRAAKPLPPVTTHHFCSPSILHKALQTAVYWLTFTFNNWIHSLPFFFGVSFHDCTLKRLRIQNRRVHSEIQFSKLFWKKTHNDNKPDQLKRMVLIQDSYKSSIAWIPKNFTNPKCFPCYQIKMTLNPHSSLKDPCLQWMKKFNKHLICNTTWVQVTGTRLALYSINTRLIVRTEKKKRTINKWNVLWRREIKKNLKERNACKLNWLQVRRQVNPGLARNLQIDKSKKLVYPSPLLFNSVSLLNQILRRDFTAPRIWETHK